MIVDKDLCNGCEKCLPYCPVSVIAINADGLAEIDLAECVECDNCRRSRVCPMDAFVQQELAWPRSLRAKFSDPMGVFPETGLPGRGTEEIKTNDVTNCVQPGFAGIAAELGRPSVGARFRDVEKVTMALSSVGVTYQLANPVTLLMTDRATGKMRDDVLDEKALSAIIEFIVPFDKVLPALKRLKEVSADIDTVMSIDLAFRPESDGSQPVRDAVAAAGFEFLFQSKTNVGMVRPIKQA